MKLQLLPMEVEAAVFCFAVAAAAQSEGVDPGAQPKYTKYICDRCCTVMSPTPHLFNTLKPRFGASMVLTAYYSFLTETCVL